MSASSLGQTTHPCWLLIHHHMLIIGRSPFRPSFSVYSMLILILYPIRTKMFSSCSFSAATLVLAITLLTATITPTGAATLGVNYGRDGDNLPSPREVVDLYKSQGIKAMRIYYPYPDVLQALRGSGIELVLGVPNTDLQQLASDTSSAKRWVQTNVLNYLADVRIKYIAVGNEVTPVNGNSQYAQFLVRAMTNIFNAVKDAGLFQKVLVSTSLDTTVIDEKTAYPPSAGKFRGDVMWFMNPVIGFLTDTRAPIMFSIYPYFSYIYNPKMKLSYALFTNKSPEFMDNNLAYYNLFDAMLDGVHSALDRAGGSSLRGLHSGLARAGGSSLRVVVTETGWPSHGRPRRGRLLSAEDAPSIDNACTYNQNLIRHVTSVNGTPRRPGAPIETYLFSMFNENLKNGPETEKYFGLFYPNRAPVCTINFHQT